MNVYIVDLCASSLASRYQEIFPKAEISDEFEGEKAVEKMVESLTKDGDGA